jgi:hypothetical protein
MPVFSVDEIARETPVTARDVIAKGERKNARARMPAPLCGSVPDLRVEGEQVCDPRSMWPFSPEK